MKWHVPYDLHHFSRGSFQGVASRLGYEVRFVRTITPNLWTILQIRSIRVRVEPGLFSVPNAEVRSKDTFGSSILPSTYQERFFFRWARHLSSCCCSFLVNRKQRVSTYDLTFGSILYWGVKFFVFSESKLLSSPSRQLLGCVKSQIWKML